MPNPRQKQHPLPLPVDDAPHEQPATVEKILRELFGETFTPSHTPSPVLGRFRRMKGEIDRGQESLERKFRYLLWLN